MSEPWTVYLLIFVMVVLAVQQLQQGLGGAARRRGVARRRQDALAPAAASTDADALRRRESRFGRLAVVAHVNRLVLQSGTRLSPAMLGLVGVALALAVDVLLPAILAPLLRLVVGVAAAAALLEGWLRFKRGRRMARFGEQLPEVLDVIVRSLRAGHPLAVSLSLVAREMPEPAGPEFAVVIDEVSYGRSLTEALNNLHARVGYPELRFFVASTAIASQTGGNLGEILSRLSRMLRERFRLSRRVRALSAEGRFSGYALSVLPVALFGAINLVSASYYAEFWRSAAATPVVVVSIGLLAFGNLVIYRLVNFKV